MLKIDSANDRVSLDTVDKEPDGQQLSEGRAGGNALYTPNLCARLLVRQVRPLPSPNGSLPSSTCPHTYSHGASCRLLRRQRLDTSGPQQTVVAR